MSNPTNTAADLNQRLTRYTVMAASMATLPLAGTAHGAVMEVTSNSLTTIDLGSGDFADISVLQVDMDLDLARAGVPTGPDDLLDGKDVILFTATNFIDGGAPKDGFADASLGFVFIDGLIALDSPDDELASRFPGLASVDLSNAVDKAGRLFIDQPFPEVGDPVRDDGNFKPGSGSGFIGFDLDTTGPDALRIRVNDDLTITAFGVSTVPEPGTWALLALGAAGLVGARRASRKAS